MLVGKLLRRAIQGSCRPLQNIPALTGAVTGAVQETIGRSKAVWDPMDHHVVCPKITFGLGICSEIAVP